MFLIGFLICDVGKFKSLICSIDLLYITPLTSMVMTFRGFNLVIPPSLCN